MAELTAHLAYLEAELAAAQAAPLSGRKAMLVAMLADAYADRLFAAGGEGDILEFRAAMAKRCEALATVFALCALRAEGPRLVTEAVAVPIADYGQLGIEDFMVSLYNDHSVQRVRIALPDGARLDAHDVLGEAVDYLRSLDLGVKEGPLIRPQ